MYCALPRNLRNAANIYAFITLVILFCSPLTCRNHLNLFFSIAYTAGLFLVQLTYSYLLPNILIYLALLDILLTRNTWRFLFFLFPAFLTSISSCDFCRHNWRSQILSFSYILWALPLHWSHYCPINFFSPFNECSLHFRLSSFILPLNPPLIGRCYYLLPIFIKL